ncbi:MAG: tRNA (N(6)-L-threonylcarbamoyladenosine(37)-C(2))-methylthiotransferase [Candidatus Thermoplasmatota archaeon]|nr:tRNA (N(6)-L-threonylcarbamoyladenosine(37)-C(2))-methylthiotransferase [Candidatus Thermoplasmatota archaeon]
MKIYLEAYGCTLSKSEAGLYVNKLLLDGSTLVRTQDEADLSVINTCVVIKHTEDKMIRRIGDLSSTGKVKVIGCLPPVSAGSLSDPNVEFLSNGEFKGFYSGALDDVEIREPSILDGIPINQGCTGSCNFCISRVARGRLLSRPPSKIRGQVELQLKRGIREIRITSLDTAAYGTDTGIRLPDLIGEILSIGEDFRLRVGMMEPRNTRQILGPLMHAYADERVFKFMHLPVQSGDDRILQQMNREYDSSTFLEIIREFRRLYPDSTLSTDVIAGYHGDDEDSFERTLKVIESARPEILNVTRFSPRPYTKDFGARTPTSNYIKRWTTAYMELHRTLLDKRLSELEGKLERVLVTEKGKPGTCVGRDSAYRPVVLSGDLDLNTYVDCLIVGHGPTYLIGKVV